MNIRLTVKNSVNWWKIALWVTGRMWPLPTELKKDWQVMGSWALWKNGTILKTLKKLAETKYCICFGEQHVFCGCNILIKCSNNIDSDESLIILQKYQENLHFDVSVYQQKNASIHKVKKIRIFCWKQLKVLYWPAYSPDPNLIKNFWVIVKEQ